MALKLVHSDNGTTAPASTKILHLKTQRGQPYGSVRRCCERCGKMIWGDSLPSGHCWTDDPEFYANASSNEYIKCTAVA